MVREADRLTLDHLRRSLRRARARLRRLRRSEQKTRALIRRRSRQIRAARGGGGAAARWALAQVGTVEKPPGSNSGPKISGWIIEGGGRPGWPWCQYFANQAARAGGAPFLRNGYTVAVLNLARAGKWGKVVPRSEARVGDLVMFKFPGVSRDPCDHVGVYVGGGRTVEGNTSPGTGGSQNNGGGVFLRQRPTSLWAAVIRPPYA